MPDRFRVLVFSSAPARHLEHLCRRLAADLDAVQVVGILHERRPVAPAPWRIAIRRARAGKGDRSLVRFAAQGMLEGLDDRVGEAATRMLHRAERTTRSLPRTLEEAAEAMRAQGTDFMFTDDIHGRDELRFVQSLRPDLGVVFGARVLKDHLHSAPRFGSINSHQHELPDYRGSGPPGLWELQDGRESLTVAAHIVTSAVDGGDVLDRRTIPIEHSDSLSSLELKANLVGVDGLVASVGRIATSGVEGTPQPPGGRLFKGIPAHRMWAMQAEIEKTRPSGPRHPGWHILGAVVRSRGATASDRPTPPEPLVTILAIPRLSDADGAAGITTDEFARAVAFLREHARIVDAADAFSSSGPSSADVCPSVALVVRELTRASLVGLRAIGEPLQVPIAGFVPRATAWIDPGEGDEWPDEQEMNCLVRHGITVGDLVDAGAPHEVATGTAPSLAGSDCLTFRSSLGAPWPSAGTGAVQVGTIVAPLRAESESSVRRVPSRSVVALPTNADGLVTVVRGRRVRAAGQAPG